MKKLLPNHSQLSCSHYNKIYDSQLQNTKVLRMQPQQLSCKAHKNYAQRLHQLQLQNRIATPTRKNDFETPLKGI